MGWSFEFGDQLIKTVNVIECYFAVVVSVAFFSERVRVYFYPTNNTYYQLFTSNFSKFSVNKFKKIISFFLVVKVTK